MANDTTDKPQGFSHANIETNNFLMIVLILLVIAVGGLVEIVPLFFQRSTTQPVEGLKPYTALQLAGRDVYIREGCYGCHSQMIRPLLAETLRYGHYSMAGESVWDHPFQWGSKRTGPDLARVGGKYSDEWHRIHLENPRDVVPESNMPAYSWLPIGKAKLLSARTMLPTRCTPSNVSVIARGTSWIRKARLSSAGTPCASTAASRSAKAPSKNCTLSPTNCTGVLIS